MPSHPKFEPIMLRLPPADLERLRILAESSGYPIAALIRACIIRALPYVESLVGK